MPGPIDLVSDGSSVDQSFIISSAYSIMADDFPGETTRDGHLTPAAVRPAQATTGRPTVVLGRTVAQVLLAQSQAIDYPLTGRLVRTHAETPTATPPPVVQEEAAAEPRRPMLSELLTLVRHTEEFWRIVLPTLDLGADWIVDSHPWVDENVRPPNTLDWTEDGDADMPPLV